MNSSALTPIIEVSTKIWFDNVPEPIRFMTAAGLGNILFFNIDRAFYKTIVVPLTKDTHKLFQKNKETISFFFSYLIQVGFQHFLNAMLVYGIDTISTLEKYADTLILSYSSYSLSLIGSTMGNAILISRGVSKNVAFWSTIVTFGIVNFFLLRCLIGGFASCHSSSSSSSSSRGDEDEKVRKKLRQVAESNGDNVKQRINNHNRQYHHQQHRRRLNHQGEDQNKKSLGMIGFLSSSSSSSSSKGGEDEKVRKELRQVVESN
eukprot:CAMPEP_0176500822 /NCGR_PEP_ID=MMETSP0200_2-20121128/13801_1 /TAXON_ID=947934 /ORGANISM="Chaetoceros sp., Strain GSL56" /LENGTH=261 /DNA_ID=CAMNT_0017899605 /DNA_START=148 /DNA_END=930 /DNA_ORIENTATION=+